MNERTFLQVKKNKLKSCPMTVMVLMLAACTAAKYRDQSSSPNQLTPSIDDMVIAAQQQFRVINSGSEAIYNLQILFPGETAYAEAAHIEFGNIPAGEITEYQSVPDGVYRYAAYEYMSDGRLVEQAVMDWVGESSLPGEKFTYQLELNPNNKPGNQIRLVKVLVDKP